MPYELSDRLVIGIASSALFDLKESDAVFREHGEQTYREYQEKHLDNPLDPGVEFPFVRRLLSLNDLSEDPGDPLVEVIVLSRNDPDTGLRVMRSIDHHHLRITRAIFMQGKSPYKFMRPLHMSLFLSENERDVRDRIYSAPWNGAYYAPANTFMNGDPANGTYTHNTDFNVPVCGAQSPPPPPPTLYPEQQGHNGVNTFSNYHNASGPGTPIAAAAWVNVSCKVYDPTIASVNPDGYWYRIADSPWNGAYYAPANTFMNGDPWNGPYTHNTDFAVPNC